MISEPGYEWRGEWYWPKDDTFCYQHIITKKRFQDADVPVAACKQRRVVIQAGGNVGVWAKNLSSQFDTVYTFEPDPINFVALTVNTEKCSNVISRQAGLGARAGRTGLHVVHPNNMGAHYLAGDGDIEVVTIDGLNLPVCDLIILDIEGAELDALKGGIETLLRCRPVVSIELKRLTERYGYSKADVVNWLAEKAKYRRAGKINRDVVFIPEEWV